MAGPGMRGMLGGFFPTTCLAACTLEQVHRRFSSVKAASALFTPLLTQGLQLGDLFSTQMGCDRSGQGGACRWGSTEGTFPQSTPVSLG